MEQVEEKALETLEFPAILEKLEGHASFAAGAELARKLRPSSSVEEVQRRLAATREAAALLEARPGLDLGRARDVRLVANKALRGGVLEAGDLLDIAETLSCAAEMRRLVLGLRERCPVLAAVAERFDPCDGLRHELRRCVNERAEVVDEASPLLAEVRQELKEAHERLLGALESVLRSELGRQATQEQVVTVREGRYVIPLKANFKGQIPGLIHDTSASGATLFVEPLETVELGNSWKELQIQERREVERVLRSLSRTVAAKAEAVGATVEALAELDLALAKARLGQTYGGSLPQVLDFQEGAVFLSLREARHPLLRGEVVPISVRLGQELQGLVITGPNTGGKTVALKTMGLLTLMAQAGLPIPAAEGSSLPVFPSLFADIGDEQSIAQSLSTFSSHMSNVVEMMRWAEPGSLILLDEVGAGTDPSEGSALARALISWFLARGCWVVVTTHYNELKAYAAVTPGLANACVEFDPETLAPTYQLTIGLPGRSNALSIAERLGLAREVVEAARGMLSPDSAAADALLAEIQGERSRVAGLRLSLEQRERELRASQERLGQEEAMLAARRAELEDQAWGEAIEELSAIREQARRLASAVAQAAGSPQVLGEAEAQAALLRRRAQVGKRRAARRATGASQLRPGDTVMVAGLGQRGEVLAPLDEEGQVLVQVGSFRLRVGGERLRKVKGRESRGGVVLKVTRRTDLPLELDLRGRRVEEVLPEVERYLHDAYLAGMARARLIHGKGTGALRQVVREQLSGNPFVRAFAAAEPRDGGEGVTLVELLPLSESRRVG